MPRICRIGGVFLWAKSGFLKKKVLFWRRNKSPEVESAGFPCMENPGRGIQSVIWQLRRDRKEPQRTPSDFPVFLAITCVHLKNDLFFESKVRRFLVAKQSKVAVFAWDFSPVSKEQVKSAWIWRPIPGLCVCPVADPAGSACRSCRICTGSADPPQDLQILAGICRSSPGSADPRRDLQILGRICRGASRIRAGRRVFARRVSRASWVRGGGFQPLPPPPPPGWGSAVQGASSRPGIQQKCVQGSCCPAFVE